MSDARRHTGIPDRRAESAGGGDLWEVRFQERGTLRERDPEVRVLAAGTNRGAAVDRAIELAGKTGLNSGRLLYRGSHVAYRAGERKEGVIS